MTVLALLLALVGSAPAPAGAPKPGLAATGAPDPLPVEVSGPADLETLALARR